MQHPYFALCLFIAGAGAFAAISPASASTFEERRQAYLNGTANAHYVNDMDQCGNMYNIWGWLENPSGHAEDIHNNIDFYLHQRGARCKNEYWTGDHRVPIPLRWVLQYKDVIIPADYDELISDTYLGSVAGQPFAGTANYGFRYSVTGYLYTHLIKDLGTVEFPADNQAFTSKYSGRSYTPGSSYPAKELYSDYMSHMADRWLAGGTQEDFSPPYYYAQVHSMAALADFAPEDLVKRQGKMFTDFLIFNWALVY